MKIRVAVLYGGRSGEHEVSLQSAASVIRHLDRSRFEIIPIGIDKSGRWLLNDISLIEDAQSKSLLVAFKGAEPVVMPPAAPGSGDAAQLVPLGAGSGSMASGHPGRAVDVVFPVMHGPLCEDGAIQGLLELSDVAYVGSGVLGSAVVMDKDVSKRLCAEAGIPVVPFVAIKKAHWDSRRAHYREYVSKELGYPCFVKPANLGSSVGVHKVKRAEDLDAAIDDSLRYDSKILVEKGIAAREIELSVLEARDPSKPPRVSIAGEIIPTHEFYSYEAKYLDENGAALKIPAELTPQQLAAAQKLAALAFEVLECEGMARADFFLDKKTGEFYLNELNTLPGFTNISMYPKMWEASGLGYQALLTELIELAIARHGRKKHLVRDYESK